MVGAGDSLRWLGSGEAGGWRVEGAVVGSSLGSGLPFQAQGEAVKTKQ